MSRKDAKRRMKLQMYPSDWKSQSFATAQSLERADLGTNFAPLRRCVTKIFGLLDV